VNVTVDFVLLDADYIITVQNGMRIPLLRLWGRSNGKRVEVRVLGFLPYFYAEASVEQIISILTTRKIQSEDWLIQAVKCTKRIFFGGYSRQLTKVIGNIPYRVPEMKQFLQKAGIVVHEADIPFVRRFLIDKNIRSLHPTTVTGDVILDENDVLIIETSINQISQSTESEFEYQPLLLAFDIEVDEHGETIHELLIDMKRRITAISMAWGTITSEAPKTELIILNENSDYAEVNLLNKFIEKVLSIKPDVLVSFNGTFFDIPYLDARMSKLGMTLGKLALFEGLQNEIIKSTIPVESYRLKGRAVVDLMPRTWHIHPISGKKSLDSISQKVLGEKKVQLDKSLGQLWRDGLKGNKVDAKLFQDYSLKDAVLTFRLISELGVSESIELCRLTGYPLPEGILSTSRNIGELELMRILYSQNMLIPSKPSPAELRERNEYRKRFPHLGGWVLDPQVNEATFVAILDFRSLYPNIVRTHNISGETIIPDSEKLSYEKRFRDKPRGAIAELMDRILKRRYQTLEEINEIHDQKTVEKSQKRLNILEKRQYSLKIMANSLLGATNYPRGRFYHHILANSITGIARELLRDKLQRWTKEFSEKHSYEAKLRYGDTDSIFVEFVLLNLHLSDLHSSSPERTRKKRLEELLSAIDEYRSFLSNKLPDFLELQLEDVALRIILKKGRKKAYAYQSLLTNEVVIKGFEAVRSDWSPLARKAQRRLLETLIADLSDKRRLNARKTIFKLCRYILTGSIEQLIPELSIRGPVRRSPKKYRSKTSAVGAYLHFCLQHNLDPDTEFKKWDGFPYLIAKSSRTQPQYQRAYHPDVFLHHEKEIDRLHYVKEILGASKRFGIEIRESEVQQSALIIPLPVFLGMKNNVLRN
jgi:DNA polymerase I